MACEPPSSAYSAAVSQRDPIQAPCAPIPITDATWVPSPMPPAASTGARPSRALTISGTSTIVATSPV